MHKFYFTRFYILTAFFAFLFADVHAQTDTLYTMPPLTASSAASPTLTFELSSASPIVIKRMATAWNTAGTIDVWYRLGGVQHIGGQPPVITAANGWVFVASVAMPASTTPALIPYLFNIPINPGTPVGIFFGGASRYAPSASLPNLITDNTLTVDLNIGKAYAGGTFPNVGTSHRKFCGWLAYEPAFTCSTAVGGTTVANNSVVCSLGSVNLSVTGGSSGSGISFQWQSSTDSITWSNVPNEINPTYLANPATTTFYRRTVTCGALSDNSVPVKVSTIGTSLPAGMYTIDKSLPTSGTNFSSFTSFFNTLSCGGIAGPVTVNVLDTATPYTEQLLVSTIAGTSATNTITIQGNGATLTSSIGNAFQRATLTMDGTQHIIFKNLNISSTHPTIGYTVQLQNDARFLTFDSCHFQIPIANTALASSCFVLSNNATSPTTAGLAARDLTLTNNIFEGGYYSLVLNGPTSAPWSSDNLIENNVFIDFHLYGIYARGQENSIINNNDFSRPNRLTVSTFYGIYLNAGVEGLIISGNNIHNTADNIPTNASANYPFYMTGAIATAANPCLIYNNLVHNINNSGLTYGIYILSGDNINFYHNTVSLNNDNAAGINVVQRNVFISATSGSFHFKNNIFDVSNAGTGTKHLVYMSSNIPVVGLDYNQYNISSSAGLNHVGFFDNTNYSTLANWQTANSSAFESNGVYGDAVFTDLTNGDLAPQSNVGNNAGTNLLSLVPLDFNGATRTATPDIGAIEFTPLGCLQPFGIVGITSDSSASFTWSNDPDADSVRIEYGVAGFNQGTGIAINLNDTAITISGLLQNTCYDFYFTSYCNGILGSSSGLITICTECGAAPMPYIEDFATWPPACFAISGTGAWTWISHPSGFAEANFWNNSTGSSTMKTSNVLISTSAIVKFKWAKLYSSTYPNDRLILRAKTLNGTQWDTLKDLIGPSFSSPNTANTAPPPSTDFIEEQITLDPTKYLNQIAEFELIAISGWGPRLYIDEFIVEAAAQCLPPFLLNATSIGTSNATINWSTVTGTCFTLEYGPQGFTNATGQGIIINNVTSPTLISNLASNTFYDVYVRDCCDSNNWSGPYTFKTNCTNQLNGMYTIGGTAGPTNFATLDSAISTLNGCGVSGAVTFNLAAGTFTTSIVLGSITGVNATNTVTFNGVSPAADTIIIPTGTINGIDLNGTSYVTFKNLTVDGSGSDRIVWLHNNANHITFDNCHLLHSLTAIGNNNAIIAATATSTATTSTGNNANNIQILNCKFGGAYYGITIYGTSATERSSNFIIENCEFDTPYFYAIRGYYINNIEVIGNKVEDFGATGGYGYYGFQNDNFKLNGNFFAAKTYGIYMMQGNNSGMPTNNSQIINNMLIGGTYGLYLGTTNHVNVYHNSIAGTTYGGYITGSNNLNIRNNIFQGGTYAIYSATNMTSQVVNYNIYHSTVGPDLIYWGTVHPTLNAWKTATPALNINSLQGAPGFASATDLSIVGSLPNDVGLNGLATEDIFGNQRPALGALNVDIGAHEFTPNNHDAALQSIVLPSVNCGDSLTQIQVVVKNDGLLTITSLPIVVQVSGGITSTLNTTATVNIAAGMVDTIAVGTLNTYLGATNVNFVAIANLPNDQDNSNDTVSFSSVSFIPYEPQFAVPDTICPKALNADFAALPNALVKYGWFMNTSDTSLYLTGENVNLPVDVQQTWYLGYVDGDETTLTTGYAGGNACAGGVMFNITAKRDLKISAFDVNTSLAAGTQVPLSVYYIANGSYVGNETNQANWTLHGSTTQISAGPGMPTNQVLPTTLVIPAGATYAIYLQYAAAYTGGNASNQTVTNFDATLTMGTGLCGSFSGIQSNQIFNGGVVYTVSACSQIKVPITPSFYVDTAFADFTYLVQINGLTVLFDASSSIGNVFNWDFGDGISGTGIMVQHTYQNSMIYIVQLIVGNTDCNNYDTIYKTVFLPNIEESLLAKSLSIYPNPNTGNFRVSFMVEGVKSANINVVNPMGQVVYTHTPGNISGEFKHDIDLGRMAAGVYIVQITTDDGIISRRVTLQK